MRVRAGKVRKQEERAGSSSGSLFIRSSAVRGTFRDSSRRELSVRALIARCFPSQVLRVESRSESLGFATPSRSLGTHRCPKAICRAQPRDNQRQCRKRTLGGNSATVYSFEVLCERSLTDDVQRRMTDVDYKSQTKEVDFKYDPHKKLQTETKRKLEHEPNLPQDT